jgi:hypothetical protein
MAWLQQIDDPSPENLQKQKAGHEMLATNLLVLPLFTFLPLWVL